MEQLRYNRFFSPSEFSHIFTFGDPYILAPLFIIAPELQNVCGNTKQVVFWAHFNNYSGIFLQNSLQDTIFGIFALKFASYAHLIL